MIEANYMDILDELWVLKLSKEEAFERVKKRNPNLTSDEILSRLSRQLSDDQRLEHATWSYDTGASSTFDQNMLKVDKRIE